MHDERSVARQGGEKGLEYFAGSLTQQSNEACVRSQVPFIPKSVRWLVPSLSERRAFPLWALLLKHQYM